MQDIHQILTSPILTWDEGMNFFRGEGLINKTLRRLACDLERHGIDYSLIGAIALNQHGYQRFTIDKDLDENFAEKLNPFVQEKFIELASAVVEAKQDEDPER